MLRQALSTSSRALRPAARLASSQPLLRPQFQNAPAAWSLRAAQPAVARWYSDAKEAPAEGEKASTEAKEGAGQTDAVAELKKSLEAKDAEARDWKVSNNKPFDLPMDPFS
jgi:molecular chaperone GrpE